MCLYLIGLYNLNGCLLKLKLKLLNVQKGNHTNTIHANSPVYGTDLLKDILKNVYISWLTRKKKILRLETEH